jgi:activator of 2-hydroxyglutaryl-CoA dehydratase
LRGVEARRGLTGFYNRHFVLFGLIFQRVICYNSVMEKAGAVLLRATHNGRRVSIDDMNAESVMKRDMTEGTAAERGAGSVMKRDIFENAVLGIELGSTRIKAVLLDGDGR